MSTTLAAVFDPHRNSLNAIRLALATLVIVSHSWPLGGVGADPAVGGQEQQNLGQLAVAGFFAISGFLITGSRINSASVGDYLWRRVLRIYPGFLVCLVVTAFVIAPLATLFFGGGRWTVHGAEMFVERNALLKMSQYGIPHTLTSVPFPEVWNGALWTLFYEFLCYLAIGAVVSMFGRRPLLPVAVVFVGCVAVNVVAPHVPANAFRFEVEVTTLARLGVFFVAGAMLYLLRDRVPLNSGIAVAAGVLFVVSLWTNTFSIVGSPMVAYLMLYLGVVLPLHRVGARNDISYGIYIYGFAVQQVIALALPGLSIVAFIVLAVVVTVPLAAGSWFLVERPAMTLKRWTARHPLPENHVPTT